MKKFLLILIFPILVITWAIGWTMFHTGPVNNRRAKQVRRRVEEDAVQIIGPITDEAPLLSEES